MTIEQSRLNVLMVVRHSPPIRCGTGDYAFRLAQELQKEGCRVQIFANRKRWGFKTFMELWAMLKQDFNVLHLIHSSEFPTFSWIVFLPWIARRRKLRSIVTFGDYALNAALRGWIYKTLSRLSDAVIFVEEKPYEQRSKEKPAPRVGTWLIPTSAGIIHEEETPQRFNFVKRPGEQILATFGFAKPDKGIETILYALKRVITKKPSTKFLFISGLHDGHNDAYALELERIIQNERLEDYVIETGFCEGGMLLDFLRSTDVFVCPFRDGFSSMHTTAITALSAGLPVISTRNGHLPEGVVPDQNMIFVDIENHEQLAAAILRLLDNNDQREAVGKAGRRLFNERYAWNVVIDSHLRVYKQLSPVTVAS